MNPVVILLLMVGASILLMIVLSQLFRRWLSRGLKRINLTSKRQRLDEEVDGLLEEMGNRMDRPWMSQELQVITGYREQALHALLRRGRERGCVRTEWRVHPVTEEEFEAYMLTRRGVRQFGAYAPDDQLSLSEDEGAEEACSGATLEPVRISDYQPADSGHRQSTTGTGAGSAAGPGLAQDDQDLSGENEHGWPFARVEPVRGIRSRKR